MDETRNLPAEREPQLPAAAPAASPYDFTPTNLQEAMQLAKMLSESNLVPKAYVGKPGDCLIAMQHGHEIGLKPSQALQSIASINGKPSIYGDAGKALLLSRGCRIDELDIEDVKATGVARCVITRSSGARTERSFSVDDAKAAKLWGKDGPWSNYPQRMLMWRAFWYAARDGAADVLKGLQGVEEMRDITDEGQTLEVKGPQARSAKAAATNAPQQPAAKTASRDVDPQTGEVAKPKGNGAPPADPPGAHDGSAVAASAGMISHIKKRMDNATLTEAECFKKFGITTLDGISVAQANAIIAWTANPAG
jgi:hypothetical protein